MANEMSYGEQLAATSTTTKAIAADAATYLDPLRILMRQSLAAAGVNNATPDRVNELLVASFVSMFGSPPPGPR